MLFVRMVLRIEELETIRCERVLWIDDSRTNMYLIDIFNPNAIPFKAYVEEYEMLVREGRIQIVEEPFISEATLTPKSDEVWKKRLVILDEIMQTIGVPEVFLLSKIWKQLVSLESNLKCSANVMKKILRIYWQKGLNKKALIPNFGRGKIIEINQKTIRLPETLKNETDKWSKIILQSFERYYKKNPQATLQSAYEEMLEKHFTDEILIDGTTKLNLKKNFPSYWQFEYHTRHLRLTEDTLRKRWGSSIVDLKGRAIIGVTQEKIFGPGSLFQIDATIADVYIVSSLNREDIIGRPVIYFITDAFSRLVTGIYCGLEGPSWNGAMMALVNSVSNKVDFCNEYDVMISDEEWACSHIPEAIRADRGELMSKNAEEMIRMQDIRIENTPPFRADLKGVIERKFGIIQGNIKPFIPGYVDKDYGKRGAKDYRLDAALTLKEFTKIIILEVLHHNKQIIKGYRKTKELLKNKVNAIPNELWSWGIENLSGSLRKITVKEMKLTLLPSYEATVTSQGLRYRGIYYTNPKAIKEEWFSRARLQGTWKVKVRIDERNTNQIFFWDELTNDLEVFDMVPFDKERFNSLSFDEVASLNDFENFRSRQIAKAQLEDKINKNAKVRKIAENAIHETKQSDSGISNLQRTQGIRENRSIEKENNRRFETFGFKEDISETVENKKDLIEDTNLPSSIEKHNLLDILDELEKDSGW